jgi:hypothetical protein
VNNSVNPMNAIGNRNNMQILGQKRAERLAAQNPAQDVGNQNPGRLASVGNNQAVSSMPGPSSPDRMATIEGLLEAWGENGSKYDLDQDGTVGMSDLISLIQRLSGEPKGPTPPTTAAKIDTVVEPGPPSMAPEVENGVGTIPTPPAPGPYNAVAAKPEDGGSTNPGLTVDGLLDAWGQKGSPYDFDGNGVVGMADLTTLLARLGNTGGTDPANPANPAMVASTTNGPIAATGNVVHEPEERPTFEPPTLKGLLDAWGEKGTRYDSDGDGVVGMGDLMAMLNRMSEAEERQSTGNHIAGGPVQSIVGQPNPADEVLARLQTLFPGGLGVDVRG